ncbi:Rieske (2Fe-2S) protein [Gilvimarinus sp. SDUM040013]|uniref:Rieske (2Fe-2S) protein n=1 Tax=Gilvimarinus gilvus TaxID=3058038 RepID=A0ABU4S3D8_9GAMM|nr:Rieske (2Fe-2S) protein [Gilvimarinus sp. SDUM040013]MDO3386106.1 Rieske (2Fe-2S) protein [Gilvimarinus sp. SDUM040013]MDX6850353.1 Rieske (2Fe-2S) protein [Gilvimarinus sp. SDUM040013]
MTELIALCASDALAEGASRGFAPQINGAPYPVFAVRKGGHVFAYRNLCPHAFIPLEWVPDQFLTSDKSLIQCANHGALFTLDTGQCIAGPCNGQSLIAVATVERDGALYLEPPRP